MRFYRRSGMDLEQGIFLAHSEADAGRVVRALERLADLRVDFPEDPSIAYAEGIIRRDQLGEGLLARDLFERASEDASKWWAVQNALFLSRSEEEFGRWARRYEAVAPADEKARRTLTDLRASLDAGVPWHKLLVQMASAKENAKAFGAVAAGLEVALTMDIGEPEAEADLRRHRAQALRELDKRAEAARFAQGFPPSERLALLGAMRELEAALALDPYDAELWNLKSAWCIFLDRFEDSIAAADKAIELIPSGYPRPHLNKATALRNLGRIQEAMPCAQESLAQAKAANSTDQIRLAEEVIEHCSTRPSRELSADDLKDFSRDFATAAHQETFRYVEQLSKSGDPGRISKGILDRMASLSPVHVDAHAGWLAETLAAFPADFVFCFLIAPAAGPTGMVPRFLAAARTLVLRDDAVWSRDAARLLVLWSAFGIHLGRPRAALREVLGDEGDLDAAARLQLIQALSRELATIDQRLPHLVFGTGERVPDLDDDRDPDPHPWHQEVPGWVPRPAMPFPMHAGANPPAGPSGIGNGLLILIAVALFIGWVCHR